MAILLVLFQFCPSIVYASEDVLYWIDCTDCDPSDAIEAELVIVQEAGPHSCLGESCTFSPGDEFIIENLGPPYEIERWKFTAANTYINTSSVGFICDNAPFIGGVGECYDLTPDKRLPHPPWVVPDNSPTPNASAELTSCNYGVGVFINTWWAAPSPIPSQSFEVERKISSSWYPYYEGDPTCVVYSSSGNTSFRVRALNYIGPSGWVLFSANHNCSGGGEPN